MLNDILLISGTITLYLRKLGCKLHALNLKTLHVKFWTFFFLRVDVDEASRLKMTGISYNFDIEETNGSKTECNEPKGKLFRSFRDKISEIFCSFNAIFGRLWSFDEYILLIVDSNTIMRLRELVRWETIHSAQKTCQISNFARNVFEKHYIYIILILKKRGMQRTNRKTVHKLQEQN